MAKSNEVDKMKIEKVRNELRARGYDPYNVLREKLKEIWRTENQTEALTVEGTYFKMTKTNFVSCSSSRRASYKAFGR